MSTNKEKHKTNTGGIIREVVFGANDGMVSTLALVAGLTGAALNNWIIVLAGLTEVFTGAISMAVGTYISTKSQREYYNKELNKEKYEIKNLPKKEIEEVREIYRKKGFKGKDLDLIVKTITANKKRWLDEMMVNELGLVKSSYEKPINAGLWIGISFIIAGMIPVIPYLLKIEQNTALIYAGIFTIIALFIVGAVKGNLSARVWWKAGMEMVIIGGITATIGYLIGNMFSISHLIV